MKVKIKPPAETKAQLMVKVTTLLQAKYPTNPAGAIEYLCNFFTSADLDGIAKELQK